MNFMGVLTIHTPTLGVTRYIFYKNAIKYYIDLLTNTYVTHITT